MNDLLIEKTERTPLVILKKKGLIEIKGNSLIENTKTFYAEIIEWVKNYVKEPGEKTTINFAMDYYNTSSQMWIFQTLNVLADLYRLKKDITINWYYMDIDLRESGEDLAILLNIDINLIESAEAFKY